MVIIIYNLREPLRMTSEYDLVNDEKSFHLVPCLIKELPTQSAVELNITDFNSKKGKQPSANSDLKVISLLSGCISK